ncbi:MAG: hypothetical protein C5B59_20580 [Bacteroidetes bacterium]|nr:MAG: hypothetical protein C5B59_20580 [Bacteroidota bacterium]
MPGSIEFFANVCLQAPTGDTNGGFTNRQHQGLSYKEFNAKYRRIAFVQLLTYDHVIKLP